MWVRFRGSAEIAGLDIAGLDNGGLDIDLLDNGGLDIAGLDIARLDIDGLDNNGQALMKRVNKEGLKEDYTRDQELGSVVHCLTSLPLPPREIADAVSDIQVQLDADSQHASSFRS